jgi:hypothetical protein
MSQRHPKFTRFTLTELMMTIVVIVILLSLGMRGVREIRSAALARLGVVEMKQAVQKAYQFSLFNEIPSTIRVTKESTGMAKGAIQATQGFAMNGYFTLDNGTVGQNPGSYENNSREKPGELSGADALTTSDDIATGLVGNALDLTEGDSMATSFKMSEAGDPVHITMWMHGVDFEDLYPANELEGYAVIWSMGSFEARVQTNRLYFVHKNVEFDGENAPAGAAVGSTWVSKLGETWNEWWTDIDPSESKWNKLGVTILPNTAPGVTWNGIPIQMENKKTEKTPGTKKKVGASGNSIDKDPYYPGQGFPSTAHTLSFPRALEAGKIDNIGTYDLGNGPAVFSDPKAGYYSIVDENYDEVKELTITLNEKGEVTTPNYAFIEYVPNSEGESLVSVEISGRIDKGTATEGFSFKTDGNTIEMDLTELSPAEFDMNEMPSSGLMFVDCVNVGGCPAKDDGEWIQYSLLGYNENTKVLTINITNRNSTSLANQHDGAHNSNHGRYDWSIPPFPDIIVENVDTYVEFIKGKKPTW